MKTNLSVKMLIGVSAATGFAACSEKSSSEQQPNIIYFLVDDMGLGDLSMYGQKAFSTPNIDRLAADGMVFSNHYTGSTVSGPSRACLMTGKHTGRATVRGNQPGPQVLDDNEATLASVLKSAGYKTAVIGKWGIGHPVPLDDPKKKGFDHQYGYLNMWHAHNCFPEFLYRNGVKETLEGNVTQTDENGVSLWANMPEGTGVATKDGRKQYAPDLFLKDAEQFIADNKENPFFIYYALNLPHANNEAAPLGCETPSIDADLAEKDWPEVEKGFAQMMRIVDAQVGALVAQLEKQGIADNTIIMFASDNGPHQEGGHVMEYFNSNLNFRGMKRAMYEGGVRTPFIVKWPAKVQAGSESNHLSAFWDVLPTFCDAANIQTPEGLDGISFFSTLVGEKEAQKAHEYLYFEFYEEGGKQSVVAGDWKYVKLNVRRTANAKPLKCELYNLASDRSETTNVAAENPQVVEQMEAYIKDGHTPFPVVSLFEDDGIETDMSHN